MVLKWTSSKHHFPSRDVTNEAMSWAIGWTVYTRTSSSVVKRFECDIIIYLDCSIDELSSYNYLKEPIGAREEWQ